MSRAAVRHAARRADDLLRQRRRHQRKTRRTLWINIVNSREGRYRVGSGNKTVGRLVAGNLPAKTLKGLDAFCSDRHCLVYLDLEGLLGFDFILMKILFSQNLVQHFLLLYTYRHHYASQGKQHKHQYCSWIRLRQEG